MEKIASFTVNHTNLLPGVYISRIDRFNDTVLTTFDLRMVHVNHESVLNTAEMHTLEHLGATFLRNHPEYRSHTVYFGPMGCRTGFYMILEGEYTPYAIQGLLSQLLEFVIAFEGDIPGAKREECGNYLDQNLEMAKYWARRYLKVIEHLDDDHTVYPQ